MGKRSSYLLDKVGVMIMTTTHFQALYKMIPWHSQRENLIGERGESKEMRKYTRSPNSTIVCHDRNKKDMEEDEIKIFIVVLI